MYTLPQVLLYVHITSSLVICTHYLKSCYMYTLPQVLLYVHITPSLVICTHYIKSCYMYTLPQLYLYVRVLICFTSFSNRTVVSMPVRRPTLPGRDNEYVEPTHSGATQEQHYLNPSFNNDNADDNHHYHVLEKDKGIPLNY